MLRDSNDTSLISGIYKIFNIINYKYYVGSSQEILTRWRKHRCKLNGNKHENPHLQNAWKKDHEENFRFLLIEHVPPIREKLWEVEDKYLAIAKTERNRCYNLYFEACGGNSSPESKEKSSRYWKEKYKNGYISPMKGKKHSQETKEKISINHADFNGRNNPNFGKHLSAETKSKISLALIGKMTGKPNVNRRSKTIFKFLNKKTNEIFEGIVYDFVIKYQLSHNAVSHMLAGKCKSSGGWVLIKA
jgi:group I intron endonuclease